MAESEPITIRTTEAGGLEVIADSRTMEELVNAIENPEFARDYKWVPTL